MTRTLDSMLCFSLYAASHATAQAYRTVLGPWKLTYPQFIALVALSDGDLTVSRLGESLMLDSGTVSPLVQRLEKRGLVARRRESEDERVVTVALTDAGRSTLSEVDDAVACLAVGYRLPASAVPATLETLNGVREGMREIATAVR